MKILCLVSAGPILFGQVVVTLSHPFQIEQFLPDTLPKSDTSRHTELFSVKGEPKPAAVFVVSILNRITASSLTATFIKNRILLSRINRSNFFYHLNERLHAIGAVFKICRKRIFVDIASPAAYVPGRTCGSFVTARTRILYL